MTFVSISYGDKEKFERSIYFSVFEVSFHVSISYGDKEKFEPVKTVFHNISNSFKVSISYGDKEKFEPVKSKRLDHQPFLFQSPMEIKRNLNKRGKTLGLYRLRFNLLWR